MLAVPFDFDAARLMRHAGQCRSADGDGRFPAVVPICPDCAPIWRVLNAFAAVHLIGNIKRVCLATGVAPLILPLGLRSRAVVDAARELAGDAWGAIGVREVPLDVINPAAIEHAKRPADVDVMRHNLGRAAGVVDAFVHDRSLDTRSTRIERTLKGALSAIVAAFNPELRGTEVRTALAFARAAMMKCGKDLVRDVQGQLGEARGDASTTLDTTDPTTQMLLLNALAERSNSADVAARLAEVDARATAAEEAAMRAGAKPSWRAAKEKQRAARKEPRPRPGSVLCMRVYRRH